jgi:uncharacterized protein YcbX
LLAWRAAYPLNPGAELDPADPPHAMVTHPDGRRGWRWGDPELHEALERDLGRPVRLLREPAGVPDVPGAILVTSQGTLRALAEELGADVDLRRFRPNLHLELDAEPWAEADWTGAEAEFDGGLRLRLGEPCERCAIPTRDPDTQEKWPGLLSHLAARHEQNFGILARVVRGGRVAAGERVRIRTALPSGSAATGR